MLHPRWVAFLGSQLALSTMTVISVGIGVLFSHVPDAVVGSLPIGEIAGVALLTFFGVRSLKVRWRMLFTTPAWQVQGLNVAKVFQKHSNRIQLKHHFVPGAFDD